MKDLDKMVRLAVRAEYHSGAAGESACLLKRNEGWSKQPVPKAELRRKRWGGCTDAVNMQLPLGTAGLTITMLKLNSLLRRKDVRN